ncbi:WD40-repeat-containing domain protein [Scleroderma citrinum]
MIDDVGIVSLGQDGVISKWTRNNQNHWQWAKLLDAGKEDSVCFAYQRDRIAVAFPRLGVKVWIWIKGTWQPQRSILRQNVTSIKFVEDGEALIGGTSDGVLWYCQVPNGTLRAYAFLKSKVLDLDVNAAGTHALVSQAGGRAHLVGIQQMDHKGKIEQVYATNGDVENKQGVGAVFANSCRSVLFGTIDNNLLVWDKTKGEIIYGLDHDGEQAQAIACFDKGPNAYIVTGTKSGLLCWWKPPPAD